MYTASFGHTGCPQQGVPIVPLSPSTTIWEQHFFFKIRLFGASLMAQWVKNLPAMQKTQETLVQSLGWEGPLEEENGNPLQ